MKALVLISLSAIFLSVLGSAAIADGPQQGSVNVVQDCGTLTFDKNTQQLMFTSNHLNAGHPAMPLVLLFTDHQTELSNKIKNLFFVDSTRGEPGTVVCSGGASPDSMRLCKLDQNLASNGVKVSVRLAVAQGRSIRQDPALGDATDFLPGYIGESYSFLLYDLDSDPKTGVCKFVN